MSARFARLGMLLWWWLAPLAACDACGGCGGAESAPAAEPSASPSEAPPESPTGIVEGVVLLASDHELPAYKRKQMEAEVLDHARRAALPKECTPPKKADRRPVGLTPEGALTGVLVAASEFDKSQRRPPVTHEVKIEDCRLTPAFLPAMTGDTVRVTNEVDYPFMPNYTGKRAAKTLLPGQSLEFAIDKPGTMRILCGFTAPCGRTDIAVMLHSIYALTNDEGAFRIENAPADEPFVLNAWHPLFKSDQKEIQVAAGETKRVEFVLTPRPGAEPASDEDDGKADEGQPAAEEQGDAKEQGDVERPE